MLGAWATDVRLDVRLTHARLRECWCGCWCWVLVLGSGSGAGAGAGHAGAAAGDVGAGAGAKSTGMLTMRLLQVANPPGPRSYCQTLSCCARR
jgi:hypothetical protein